MSDGDQMFAPVGDAGFESLSRLRYPNFEITADFEEAGRRAGRHRQEIVTRDVSSSPANSRQPDSLTPDTRTPILGGSNLSRVMSPVSGTRQFTAQAAIVAAAIVLCWTIVSWTFLVTSHAEGTPTPPLDAVQTLLLLPGVIGLGIVERWEPVVGQPVAFFSALMLIVLIVAPAAALATTLLVHRRA
jgi:hypothetical protein